MGSRPSPNRASDHFTTKFTELLSAQRWEDSGSDHCEAYPPVSSDPFTATPAGSVCKVVFWLLGAVLNLSTFGPVSSFLQVLQDPKDLRVSHPVPPNCHLLPGQALWPASL